MQRAEHDTDIGSSHCADFDNSDNCTIDFVCRAVVCTIGQAREDGTVSCEDFKEDLVRGNRAYKPDRASSSPCNGLNFAECALTTNVWSNTTEEVVRARSEHAFTRDVCHRIR